jgi:hypothetical protein
MAKIEPLIDRRVFTGVMDSDSALHQIAPGDYRDLINGFNGITTDRGAITNVPGCVKITGKLPQAGTNKCIGAVEDIEGNSIVFFNYNSEGYHGIYRWFKNKPGYPQGVIETVFMVSHPTLYTPFNPNPLNFTPDNLITGAFVVGDLLFFTDDNDRSKVIDMARANETNKRRKFNLYFNPNVFGQTVNYVLKLYKSGAGIVTQLSWSSSANDYEGQIDDFMAAYRASTAGRFFSVESCEQFITATMTTEGGFVFDFQGDSQFAPVSVPENFYPEYDPSIPSSYRPAMRDLFDRLAYTPYREPYVSYQTDPSFSTSYVRNKVFQFRVRYKYFDDSVSVYSAISKVPIPQESCSPGSFISNNYILVDFTDERLYNPDTASIIKEVEIAVLQPTISSQWVTVKRLKPYEFIPLGTQNYKFYNNETTEPIAQSDTDKPYDNLFIKHKSDVFIDNRSFPCGGTMGYDTPCIDMKAEVEYLPPTQTIPRYNITGQMVIQNLWYDGGTSNNDPFQPQILWKPANIPNAPTYMGGWGRFNIPGFWSIAIAGNAANYKQVVPLDGIPVYLAGTNYYGIARHPRVTTAMFPFLSGVPIPPQDNNGVFLIDMTAPGLRNLYDFLNALWDNQANVPLNYSINNVPPGRYVLRVASHLLTSQDISDVSLNWQKTSTNTGIYDGASPNYNIHEQVITISNADVSVGNPFLISDLIKPNSAGAAIGCYIVADDNPNFSGTLEDYKGETRVDLARVRITNSNNTSFGPMISVTDHNGYTYGISKGLSGNAFTSNLIFSSVYSTGYNSMIDDSGAAWTPVPDGYMKIGYFRITNTNIRDFGRTHIEGKILNATGEPIAGIPVVTTRGEWDKTDKNGIYKLKIYADTTNFPTVSRREDTVFYANSGPLCQADFNPLFIPYSLNIGQNDYNNTNILYNPDIEAIIINTLQSVQKWKRGSSRYFGLVYADEGDRKTAVAVMNSPVNILFYTEKDKNGVIPPTGAANVILSIYHEPPEWAVKYYVVAMEDQTAVSHIQWVMNEVTPIGADGQPNVVNPVKIQINIDNIGFYTNNLHPQAVIPFDYGKGDFIRIISAAGFQGNPRYLEYEIIDRDTNNIYIPVDNTITFQKGDVFEAYKPRTQDQTRIFYELATYEIRSAIFNGVLKKYHVGNLATQNYSPYPDAGVLPAVIKLTTGDVYYRLRNIPYNYSLSNPSSAPLYKSVYISDNSVSDFYPSRAIGWGRPNTDKLPGQREMGSTVIISNPYNRNTLTNGLRSFEPLNFKQLPVAFGKINKALLVSNTVMKLIFSNSYIVSIYVNQDIIRSSVGNTNLISISDDILPRTYAMERQFGTTNPESVVVTDKGHVYGWDAKTSVVWMDTGSGLIAISELKYNSKITGIGAARNALGVKQSEVIGVYDKNNDMYVLTYRPMQPFEGRKSEVVIKALDSGMSLPNPTLIQLRIHPLNILLMSTIAQTNPNFPDISAMIVSAVNAYGNGWSATTDEFGYAVIQAPDGSSVYQNQIAVLSYSSQGFYKEFSYIMNNGMPAGTGQPYEGDTLVFSEDKKGWVQRYDYGEFPEMYCSLKNNWVAFLNGEFWLMGDESNYNNFFGNQRKRSLQAVFNDNWIKSKIYTFIEVNTDSEVYCPEITIPPYEANPTGMSTEIGKSNFRQVLGKYWAKLRRDKNTPDVLMINNGLPPTPDNKLTNGREMKGYVAIVNIDNDSNKKAPLIEAHLGYIFAERS